jgi:hypothetical protein
LQIRTHQLWKSLVAGSWLGVVSLVSGTATVHAQTYYYYPSSVTSFSATRGSYYPPVYYWPAGYQRQVVWSGYSYQYYQTSYSPVTYQAYYTPQYYQTAYNQQAYQAVDTTQASQETATALVVQTSYEATAAPGAAETSVPAGDPYGFTAWLNATRAAYGLTAVGYDPNLASWAALNNGHQASRGMGHFVMGPARRQNSAMGVFPGIESMWMASPAHRAALLDPTIRWIGIAALGAYWTFNAN